MTKLEGHSVERMYLRQRCSDGSVNKTILKPRLTLVARRQWDFPDVKLRVAALIRHRRKQSGSGIQTMIRTGSKVNQFVHVPTSVDMQHFIQIHARIFE